MGNRTRPVVRTLRAAFVVSSLLLLSGCGGDAKDPRFWDIGQGIIRCPGSHVVHGIDVSEFQGSVDWAHVKAAGKDFAIARVSYGAFYPDHDFSANWPAIRSAGLIRGVYQYFRPNEDPIAQADLLLHELSIRGGLKAGDLPPVMDIEETDGVPDSTIRSRMASWLARVKSGTGRTPLIYSAEFMSGAIGSGFGGYPLWVANYGVSCPALPSGWGSWRIWQSTSTGSVWGIGGLVDLDEFDGTLAELKTFAGESAGLPLAGIEATPVARNADGRLQVFVRGTTGSVYTRAQLTPGGAGGWSSWTDLGGILTTQPVVGENADGRLELFARGTNDEVYHTAQASPGGAFGPWESLGGRITSAVGVGLNMANRLEIFVRGSNDAVYHKWQLATGGWSSWESLGGVITSNVAVAKNADGRLEIFVRGTNNDVFHNYQRSSGGWSGWASLGGQMTSDIAAGRNADGRLEIFARGTNDAVYHAWQDTAGGSWSGWAGLGGLVSSDVSVVLNTFHQLEIFARGADDSVFHDWFHARTGWSGWNGLGGKTLSAVAVVPNADGRLETFVEGDNGALYHAWQDTPGGNWSGWSELGSERLSGL